MPSTNDLRHRLLGLALLGSLCVAGCGGDPSANKANFEPTVDTSQAVKSEDAKALTPEQAAAAKAGKPVTP